MITINRTNGALVINAVGTQDEISIELAEATAQILLSMTREDKMDDESLMQQGEAWGGMIGAFLVIAASPEGRARAHMSVDVIGKTKVAQEEQKK